MQVSPPPPPNHITNCPADRDRERGRGDRDRDRDRDCSPDRSTPLLNTHHNHPANHPLANHAPPPVNHHHTAAVAGSNTNSSSSNSNNNNNSLSAATGGGASLGPHPPGNHPVRAAPLASPRTHMRETTKDIVTAVTHQDINGLNAVSTVALKDIDVQMTALSGYETYV